MNAQDTPGWFEESERRFLARLSEINAARAEAARVQRLHDAAPELLAALKRTQALLFLRTTQSDEEAMSALSQARAAIQKVTS